MRQQPTSDARPRSARSVRLDEAILSATVMIADLDGWAGMTLQRVATRAGVSRNAVVSRHSDPAALAAAVWRQRIAGPFVDAVESVLQACPDGKGAVSEAELAEAMSPFAYPNEVMRAAAEILLVARYESAVQQAMDDTLGALLGDWLTPVRGRLTRGNAARRAFSVAMALGLLLEARRVPTAQINLTGCLTPLAQALSQPASPHWLPTRTAAFLDEPPVFDIGDPAWVAVLRATVGEVGERGYEAATVDAIARASGYTQGAIFSRYESKLDLFLDATQRMLANNGRMGAQFQADLADEYSPGIADAVMIRELMLPHRKNVRTITFEQIRLSWHQSDMIAAFQSALDDPAVNMASADSGLSPDQARTRIHLEFARGLGFGLLADLQVGAGTLPFDVVLVPYVEGTAS